MRRRELATILGGAAAALAGPADAEMIVLEVAPTLVTRTEEGLE